VELVGNSQLVALPNRRWSTGGIPLIGISTELSYHQICVKHSSDKFGTSMKYTSIVKPN
jgi:hypothetical protein